MVEPEKEIDYKLAKKDLNKFYDKVFSEEVMQHSIKQEGGYRHSFTSKMTTRPHVKIMKKLRVALALMLQ